MRRSSLLFLTLLVLWALIAQANHELAPLRFSLFAGGLFVVFAALRMERGEGLTAVFAAGLLHDAVSPIPFGTHALLFTAAHAFVYHVRHRVHREETLVGVLAALLSNLGIFLVLSFLVGRDLPGGVDPWPRLIADLLASQLALAIITPWFLVLQRRVLGWAGQPPFRTEHRA
jgi:rod shape-determining protein MreD